MPPGRIAEDLADVGGRELHAVVPPVPCGNRPQSPVIRSCCMKTRLAGIIEALGRGRGWWWEAWAGRAVWSWDSACRR